MNRGIAYALAAAALFGSSTPFAKRLLGDMHPLVLAGMLYLGSGCGLVLVLMARKFLARSPFALAWLAGSDWGWLAGAIVCGGIIAPALLMYGLATGGAASASLLLNLEAVLTALIAWFVFGEGFDRRIAVGMGLIVGGGAVLSWTPDAGRIAPGSALVAAACAFWAIDNNLTRKIAANDAVIIAGLKGLFAGAFSLTLAWLLGYPMPPLAAVPSMALVGFLGYGVSLALFVLALRDLGTARTGAYFSVAPFIGAGLAVVMLGEPITPWLLGAGALMALGVWLHISERHEHLHTHESTTHEHSHRHDEHHRHAHPAGWEGNEPHVHPHVHAPIAHRHQHFPDIHHRHPH
ncbi:MAG: EamA family transporter [Betaproteobacteria bacterium]